MKTLIAGRLFALAPLNSFFSIRMWLVVDLPSLKPFSLSLSFFSISGWILLEESFCYEWHQQDPFVVVGVKEISLFWYWDNVTDPQLIQGNSSSVWLQSSRTISKLYRFIIPWCCSLFSSTLAFLDHLLGCLKLLSCKTVYSQYPVSQTTALSPRRSELLKAALLAGSKMV